MLVVRLTLEDPLTTLTGLDLLNTDGDLVFALCGGSKRVR